mgnify:CR=1 FL=1
MLSEMCSELEVLLDKFLLTLVFHFSCCLRELNPHNSLICYRGVSCSIIYPVKSNLLSSEAISYGANFLS